ncbi:hypothetical protein F4225_06010 [Candidatus Poribacteria bacterium]|nr:hypothetical protein [Candidatus Poribacteria bacterium]
MKTFLYSLITIIAVVVCLTVFPRKNVATPQQKVLSVQTKTEEIQRDTEKLTRKNKNCSCCKKLSHRDKIRQRAREAQERQRELAKQEFSQIGMAGSYTVTPVHRNQSVINTGTSNNISATRNIKEKFK